MRVPIISGFISTNNSQSLKKENSCMPKLYSSPLDKDLVSFKQRIPVAVSSSSFHSINALTREIKAIGSKVFFDNDGSEKILLIAQQIKKSLLEIKAKGLKIPKMEIHFDTWSEMNKSEAADTSFWVDHGKIRDLIMEYNTPKYKYLTKENLVHRIPDNPLESSIDADFHHEFAHAYQAFFNPQNSLKLKSENFSEGIKEEIINKINTIAAQNKYEFVAEYFAYKMIGKNIESEKLAKLYKECLGPEI